MQFLDTSSLLRLARCNRRMLREADCAAVWQHKPVYRVFLDPLSDPERTYTAHRQRSVEPIAAARGTDDEPGERSESHIFSTTLLKHMPRFAVELLDPPRFQRDQHCAGPLLWVLQRIPRVADLCVRATRLCDTHWAEFWSWPQLRDLQQLHLSVELPLGFTALLASHAAQLRSLSLTGFYSAEERFEGLRELGQLTGLRVDGRVFYGQRAGQLALLLDQVRQVEQLRLQLASYCERAEMFHRLFRSHRLGNLRCFTLEVDWDLPPHPQLHERDVVAGFRGLRRLRHLSLLCSCDPTNWLRQLHRAPQLRRLFLHVQGYNQLGLRSQAVLQRLRAAQPRLNVEIKMGR